MNDSLSSLRPRGRQRRTIKPMVLFYIKPCVSVLIMLALVSIALFWEGRFLLNRVLALDDYRDVMDHIVNMNHYNSLHAMKQNKMKEDAMPIGNPSNNVSPRRITTDGEITPQNNELLEPHVVLHFPAFNDDGIEMRMEIDGLLGSNAIHLIQDVNASMHYPKVVWIGSPIPKRLCHMSWVRQATEYHRSLLHPNSVATTKLNWTFHLLDWSDQSDRLLRCDELDLLVGRENVHYWKRSIVFGRHWNVSTKSVELGRISTQLNGAHVRPLHLSTRTDIVDNIATAVKSMTTRTMTPQELSDYIVSKDRPGDVAHHWPAQGRGVNRGGSRKNRNDRLRTATSVTLENMMLPPYNISNVFCGVHGSAREKGRESTANAYIDSLLQYKIVVVSQRDVFEGHLRLFEGLVSGAMVLHDRIMSAPIGLEENVNIVYFDNQNELREKVMYFLTHDKERLAVARRGRRLAMCQSRTWHRMEQIILGETVTPCDE